LFKRVVWIILTIVLFSIDQLIKIKITSSPFQISLWGDFLNVYQTKNIGLFTGIPFNSAEIVLIFILLLLFLLLKQPRYKILSLPLLIIAIGALGNLIDRIRWGFVIDYINILNFSHFNIADLLIYIGCVWTILEIIKKPKIANNE